MPLLCHSYKARNRFSQPSPKSGRTAGDRSSLTDLGRNHLCQCIDLGPLEYRSESINCCYFQPPSVWHFVTLGYCAQLLSHVWLFVTSWTLAQQAPLFNPGLNPCLLHWQADSLPLREQELIHLISKLRLELWHKSTVLRITEDNLE